MRIVITIEVFEDHHRRLCIEPFEKENELPVTIPDNENALLKVVGSKTGEVVPATFTSSDTSVATITDNGDGTAKLVEVADGTTTVTATFNNGATLSEDVTFEETFTLSVTPEPKP